MSIYSHSNVIGLSWNSPPDGKCEIHDYLRLKCPTKLTPPAPLAIMSQDWTVDKAKQQLPTPFVAATQPHFYCEASVHKLIIWTTSGVFYVSSSISISSAIWTETCATLINQFFKINFQKFGGRSGHACHLSTSCPLLCHPAMWSGHANSKSTECDSMCSQILQCDFLTPPLPRMS